MTNDLDLLGQYARENSQEAFSELVRRHLDLVYSAALRQVRSPQLAEEVAQSVFADLARSASKLKSDTLLTAWLYAVTRRTTIDVIRKESRRQQREQVAVEMNAMNATASDWLPVEPLLDDAVESLDATDRSAILLRYFENKSLREVGAMLGTTDDAAQKRVSRAVERLREFLAKRGVTVGASGLAVLIAANAVQAAPAGLAATISAAALAGTAISTSTIVAITKTVAMTTLQKTLVTATVAVLAGAGIYEAHQASQLHNQVRTLQQQQAPLAEQIQRLRRERDDATNQLASLADEVTKNKTNNLELLRLRGMAGVARRAIGEAGQLRAQLAQQASEGGTNPFTAEMLDGFKRAVERRNEGELSRLMASLHLTPEQTQAIRDILLRQTRVEYAEMDQFYAGKYDKEELNWLKKEAGDRETQIQALLTPDQIAAYPNYKQEEAAQNARWAAASEVFGLQSDLNLTSEQADQAFNALYQLRLDRRTGKTKSGAKDEAEDTMWWLDQETKALEPILTPTQFESYRQVQAASARHIRDIYSKLEGTGNTK